MRPAVCAAVIAIAACIGACGKSDSAVTSPPNASVARLQIVGGDLQRGFVDSTLDTLVTALATTQSGAPAANVAVHFTLSPGGGATFDTIAVTGADGQASCRWRLGATPGQQQLVAHIDASSVPAATATAQAYSLSQADLVIVHNALPGTISILEVTNNTSFSARQLTWPDTILRFVPRDSNAFQQSISAFELSRAPDYFVSPWTPGTDTIHLRLGAPIQLPLTVWIMHDYATTLALANADLANTDQIWQTNPTGLRIGQVQFIDATAFAAPSPPVTCQSALPPPVTTTVNVFYLPTEPTGTIGDGGRFAGYDCTPGTILRGPDPIATTPHLLAHELGHSFSLGHVTDSLNVMNAAAAGSTFTLSQIYFIFFSNQSSLNSIYGLRNIPPVPIPNQSRIR